MQLPSSQRNWAQDSFSSQESVLPDSSDRNEADTFIILGIASAVLLHRLANFTALLGTQVHLIKRHLDHENDSALDLISSVEKTVGELDNLSQVIEVFRSQAKPPVLLDVNSLLYDVWKTTLARGASKTVYESFDLPEDLPQAIAYSPLLADVLRTVFENSLKAIEKASWEIGCISIRSRYARETRVIEIEVEDNGAGIPPAILPRLFQRPIASSDSGKGMGLWLAHLMITRLGGDIRVLSTEAGQGTIMKITIPAGEPRD